MYRPDLDAFWKERLGPLRNAVRPTADRNQGSRSRSQRFVCVEEGPPISSVVQYRGCGRGGTATESSPSTPSPLHRDGRMSPATPPPRSVARWGVTTPAAPRRMLIAGRWKSPDTRRRHHRGQKRDARSAHRADGRKIDRPALPTPQPRAWYIATHRSCSNPPARRCTPRIIPRRTDRHRNQLGLEPARWVSSTWIVRQRGDVHPRLSQAD